MVTSAPARAEKLVMDRKKEIQDVLERFSIFCAEISQSKRVEDTFEGSPAAVSRKQKSNSKTLQYEGYKGRR